MRTVAPLLLLLVAACPSKGTTDDTDVTDTDVMDTDVTDTDVMDTDVTDTDVGPALACGATTCDGGAQYCLTTIPGERPDTAEPPLVTSECTALPAACLADVRCACLVTAGEIPAFADCLGDATTGLSVSIAYP